MDNILTEKSISSENGKICYWVSRADSDITLVLLPGLTANHTLYEKQIMYFADRYNIIVWDCPCHGKSRPYMNFNYANVAKELNTVIKTEKVEKAVIVGQSLGGMIGQYYIDAYPEGIVGFVAIDSAPFGDYYSKSDFFWLQQLEWMCGLFPDKTLRKSMAKMCGVTPEGIRNMEEMLADYTKKEICHLMYVGEAAFIPENKSIHLPCKCMLILGDKDKVGKVSSLNKEWTKRTGYPLMMIGNASHNSNYDNPDEVNRSIEDFVNSVSIGDTVV